MSDLERLDEALGRYENDDGAVVMPLVAEVFNAARAYRDLLAKGEREPDYEAAARALYGLMQRGKPWEDDPPGKLDHYRKLARSAVNAAIESSGEECRPPCWCGWTVEDEEGVSRLLVHPTTEEER